VSELRNNPNRSWLDRMIFAFVTRGWTAHHITGYRDNLRRHGDTLLSDVMRAFEQIDGKAIGLLTRVSIPVPYVWKPETLP
jgi:hypothetical protein